MGGGFDGLSVELPAVGETMYPNARVMETPAGHIMIYDDTPGAERVMIMHSSGAGVEMRADGSLLMKTENNKIESVAGSSTLIVEGDVTMQVNGNMQTKVAGDYEMDVSGDYSITVNGKKTENITGSSRENVQGTRSSTVKGPRSNITLGQQTDVSLGGMNQIVKGNFQQSVQGDYTVSVSATYKMSGEDFIASAENMNLAASDLSAFGASGTLGGSGMVHYGSSFYGETFHGDLDGTADQAVTADVTNSQNYPENQTGSASGYSVTNNSDASANADATLMTEYLTKSAYGKVSVTIDEGDFLKNTIDRSEANGDVSDKELSTREVRSKLRDPANLSNSIFVGNAVSAGKISNNYARSVPASIDRVRNRTASIRSPSEPINATLARTERIQPAKNLNLSKFVPDPNYDVNRISDSTVVNGKLELNKGIRLVRFLGGTGDKATLAHIPTREERLSVARQLSMHARVLRTIVEDRGEFKDYRLIVAEGLYKKGPNETITSGSINDLARKGQAVVYELHNEAGVPDLERTFDLADYWKDTINFEKLILSYDTFDPSGNLTAQIILVMPEIDTNYNLVNRRYANNLETLYNNNSQGLELIEITSA